MGNRPGNPTRLHALLLLFCLLLVVSLALLYLTRDPSESGRRDASTIAVRWDESPVPAEGATKLTVPLEEVSIRDVNERVRYSFLMGDYARTEPVGDPDVNYPAFQSATPLYGRVRFEGGDGGTSRYMPFALDHSEGQRKIVVYRD